MTKKWFTLSFTFQYVSIKTQLQQALASGVLRFTFQYVSIKTIQCWRRRVEKKYLHSNMFLLRLGAPDRIECAIDNLHSNMFLLRRAPISIKMQLIINLHSNMFLLRHYNSPQGFWLHLHLHSNMFLLRRASNFIRKKSVLIYIPICFY